MARTRTGRSALTAGRATARTARWAGRGIDRATGRRASRRWQRIRAHLRRGALRRLLAADQAWSAVFAAGLVHSIARGAAALRRRWRALTRPTAPVTDLPATVNPGREAAAKPLEGSVVTTSPEAQRIMGAADELRDALAAYGHSDVGMLAYGEGLATVPHALEQVRIGLTAMSMTALEERPVNSAVVEFLLDMAASEGLLAAKAQELLGVFANAHEADILRLTGGQRPNEWMWDRAANR